MGTPGIDPPATHQEAKDVLTMAWNELFSSDVNLFALGIAQAIGLMEGAHYGHWGPGNASNNWGAITAQGFDKKTGKCPPGTFSHEDSSFEAGKYVTCFRLYPTSLDGAKDLLRELYINRPAVFQAAVEGDVRGVAEEMYATGYYTGVRPHNEKDSSGNFSNVNNYVAFIGRGIDQISDIYPQGGTDDSGDSGNGVIVAVVGIALVGGLALALKS